MAFKVTMQLTVADEETGKIWNVTTDESHDLDPKEVGDYFREAVAPLIGKLMELNEKWATS